MKNKKIYLLIVAIFMFFSISFTQSKKNLKRNLSNCEVLVLKLDSLLGYKNTCGQEYFIKHLDPTKKNVRIIKQKEKTKRKRIKTQKRETKTFERQKTNRNFFVNVRRTISRNAWLFGLVALLSFLSGTPVGIFLRTIFTKR